MSSTPTIVASPYPLPGTGMLAGFQASLSGFGYTLSVRLEWTDNRGLFTIAGHRYQCVIPACPCDRTPCTGRGIWGKACTQADKKGAAGFTHNRDHCHGGLGAMHAQQAMVLAEAVLRSYQPRARPPARPTIGVPRGSIRVGPPAFLPLEGEHLTTVVPGTGEWHVMCDALRCRVDGEAATLSTWPTAALAQSALDRHKAWHRNPGSASPTGTPDVMTLIVPPAEIEVSDWYHNADGWQRIALMSTPRRPHESIVLWDAGDNRIATLQPRREYLVVRGEHAPAWTPVWSPAKHRYEQPEAMS